MSRWKDRDLYEAHNRSARRDSFRAGPLPLHPSVIAFQEEMKAVHAAVETHAAERAARRKFVDFPATRTPPPAAATIDFAPVVTGLRDGRSDAA